MIIKKQMLNQRQSNRVSFGWGNTKRKITVHQTGNPSYGADAQAHANLQSSERIGYGWHWQVDDYQAIQSIDHNYKVWHAGDGSGPGNTTSIGVEICINKDGNYKKSVENGARLVAKILKDEKLTINDVVQHNHWSGKNCPAEIRANKDGINWTKFLNMVKSFAAIKDDSKTTPNTTSTTSSKKSIEELAKEVLSGKYGNGAERRQRLGTKYPAVQAEVNKILFASKNSSGTTAKKSSSRKSISRLAQEVLDGLWGNGDTRKKRLKNAGFNYEAVQAEVNRILNGYKSHRKPDIHKIALEVIAGKYGNGEDRKKKLGNLYNEVQAEVNRIL